MAKDGCKEEERSDCRTGASSWGAIPWARRLEFNIALDVMFTSDDATELIAFLKACALE